MQGKGIVFTEPLQAIYQDVELPTPGDEDVVVDLLHSWISIGTESSFWRGERISGEEPYRPGGPWPFPQVAGYQKTGIVTHVGTSVTHVKEGDLVFASVSGVSNMFMSSGGHLQPSVTHGSQVWKLPDGASPLAYSGAVLTQVGYNCGMRPSLSKGDRAIVIGDGLVGHWAAQTLLHRGAEVIMLGRRDTRLDKALDGIQTRNVRRNPLEDGVDDLGPDVHIVVDTIGSMESVARIEPLLVRDSHWVSAGFLGTSGTIDIQHLRSKEITLHTPSGWTAERMASTLQAIGEGWLQTEPLITHRFAAEQAADAWQLIGDKGSDCLGIVLDWQR